MRACVCLTCAPELLAFDLADALVGQSSGVAAAGPAGLDRVVEQVVCQPLQVTVAHKGILGQMAGREGGRRKVTRRVLQVDDGFGNVMGMGKKKRHTVNTVSSVQHLLL